MWVQPDLSKTTPPHQQAQMRVEFRVPYSCREKAMKQGVQLDCDTQLWYFEAAPDDPRWARLFDSYPDVYLPSALVGYERSAKYDPHKRKYYGEWNVFKEAFVLPRKAQPSTRSVFLSEVARLGEEAPTAAGVYVLRLDSGAIYVGKSENVRERVKRHMRGGGSLWCKVHGCASACAIPTETPRSGDLRTWEEQETLFQMLRHGPNKVRGWIFTKETDLDAGEVNIIYRMIVDMIDGCFKCGAPGHYSSRCKSGDAPWKRKFFADKCELPNKKPHQTTTHRRIPPLSQL